MMVSCFITNKKAGAPGNNLLEVRCTVFILSLLSWSLSPLLLASLPWFRALALGILPRPSPVCLLWLLLSCADEMRDGVVCPAGCDCCFLLCVCSLSPFSLVLPSFFLDSWKKVNKMKLCKYCNSEWTLICNKNFSSTWYVFSSTV